MFTLTVGKRMDWGKKKKKTGYCNSTDKNSASLDEVGVIEMEKKWQEKWREEGREEEKKGFSCI